MDYCGGACAIHSISTRIKEALGGGEAAFSNICEFPNRGNHIGAEYCHPRRRIFLTITGPTYCRSTHLLRQTQSTNVESLQQCERHSEFYTTKQCCFFSASSTKVFHWRTYFCTDFRAKKAYAASRLDCCYGIWIWRYIRWWRCWWEFRFGFGCINWFSIAKFDSLLPWPMCALIYEDKVSGAGKRGLG